MKEIAYIASASWGHTRRGVTSWEPETTLYDVAQRLAERESLREYEELISLDYGKGVEFSKIEHLVKVDFDDTMFEITVKLEVAAKASFHKMWKSFSKLEAMKVNDK